MSLLSTATETNHRLPLSSLGKRIFAHTGSGPQKHHLGRLDAG